ncbi:hypothetical protein EGW08_014345, partial [Elysia chlorotica]
ILLLFILCLSINRVDADLFVVLLQGSQILTGLRELTLLHTLANIPKTERNKVIFLHTGAQRESPLGIHEVKLVVQSGPSLSNGRGVAQHAHSTLHLGQVASWDNSWGLVVDAHLETSWTPVHKLDGPLGLDGGNGCVDVLGDYVTTVQHAAGHVLAVSGITLHHLVGGLEAGIGDLWHRQLLMDGTKTKLLYLLSRNDRSIGSQGEVDPWVRYQVGLELGKIHIQGTIKPE